jgi:UDPglucose--hexose-1-phosphate uridylyltransferase
MAKYVPDVTTNRWVIVAEGRLKRPKDVEKDQAGGKIGKVCVFCPGYEKLPGEEVWRLGAGAPYEPGWYVRVIKNKYPITDFHEVIIHSPDDKLDIDTLPLEQVHRILLVFRDRYNANSKNGHVLIFNNVGEQAGASIAHPHSQLVVIPRQINVDALSFEPISNVITDSRHFTVFCPGFSQWPFEVWIAPKKRGEYFGQITAEAIEDLAGILKETLVGLISYLSGGEHFHPGMPMVTFKDGPAYNFYIHFGQDWYIRIIPRLIHRAGFELGTGLSVNIMDPTDAAEILKSEMKENSTKE